MRRSSMSRLEYAPSLEDIPARMRIFFLMCARRVAFITKVLNLLEPERMRGRIIMKSNALMRYEEKS